LLIFFLCTYASVPFVEIFLQFIYMSSKCKSNEKSFRDIEQKPVQHSNQHICQKQNEETCVVIQKDKHNTSLNNKKEC